MMGVLSRASLYAAHPGTAPPLTFSSRKRGEIVEGALVLSPDTRAGLVLLTTEECCLTPKAWAVRQDAARRTEISFMFDIFN